MGLQIDVMAAQVQLPEKYVSTKRGIVSDTARSFDILGWLSPFILRMKVLFQTMWKEKVDWDTPLDEFFAAQHVQWREELPVLRDIQLPRCYFYSATKTSIELHGFADASKLAYAAVIYARATYSDGTVSSALVVAKTKVAPLKTVSIPRLELCGAELLAELLASISDTFSVPKENLHGWTDSTSALAWLRGCPSRYKTFVGNRVALAARNVSPSIWRYIPSAQNPADCASRGLSAQDLKQHDLWWGGPPWLLQDPVPIPAQPGAAELAKAQGEEVKDTTVHAITVKAVSWWEYRFNEYMTLLHATAYVFKFCRILKAITQKQASLRGTPLSVEEVSTAEVFLYKQSQARSFGGELSRLTAAKPLLVMKSSRLKLTNPIINKDGLLAVGGRLGKAEITLLQKNPVILSASDWLTKLIFRHYHVVLAHCGPTLLLAHTATLLYVVGARQLARAVCKDCMACKRRAPKAHAQMMGQLPAFRVNPALCFIHTGIDYAGPIYLKRGNPRKPSIVKGYLAILVCLATKAVHIEVPFLFLTNQKAAREGT